jgi:hypothetical protein
MKKFLGMMTVLILSTSAMAADVCQVQLVADGRTGVQDLKGDI